MLRPPAEPTPKITQFVVDAVVMAHGKLTWESEFSNRRFERLVDVAISATPTVAIKLKFATLDQRPVIHGEMRASVELLCQRCMSNLQYPVVETFELMLIENEAELALVSESHEPWIANALRLNVLELVEEQLLLALPLIAKHADARDCVSVPVSSPLASKAAAPVAEPDTSAEVRRPFSNLRDLLGKQ